MSNYYMMPQPTRAIDNVHITYIKNFLQRNPNKILVINYNSTKDISENDLICLKNLGLGNRLQIRIVGGYDDKRVNDYQHSTNIINMHKYDNIYTLNELSDIVREIKKIEKGINQNWSSEQKLMYFIGMLKNKVIYHPFHESAASKDIRSLRGLISHRTVCAGYAMILKELCDRNGIECQYVEGCCSKDDDRKNILTHAWNIVKLNGNYIPIDLTWNAGKSVAGKMLDIGDIANANEFIKCHFPGKHELIQDYPHTLRSIDGVYLSGLNNLINKDTIYDLTTFFITRDNGKKVSITQVEEFIRENQCIYKYIYVPFDDNGKASLTPRIFYSSTNVADIVAKCNRKAKLEKQLVEARRKGDSSKIKELEYLLLGSELVVEVDRAIDHLLFSKENLMEAYQRGDYYLGKVEIENKKVQGVTVNPIFAKKINLKQKKFKRSDGTSFVLETFDKLDLGNNRKVYRYKMYEAMYDNNHLIVKKNTIFSDADLFIDNRQQLADDFLSRSRIDRKLAETGGYLGYLSSKGVRTYDPEVNKVFKSGIYKQNRMDSSHIKKYVPDLTFDDMRRIVKTYTIDEVNGKYVVMNRHTKKPVTDDVLQLQIRFSLIWLSAAGTKWMIDEPVPGYYYAYQVDSCEEIFQLISKCIVESINKTGNIDTVDILRLVEEQKGDYKYATNVVVKLFQSEYSTRIINQLFRLQNPSSKKEEIKIRPLVEDWYAFNLVRKRKAQLEEEKRQLLDVIERNGKVEIISRKK